MQPDDFAALVVSTVKAAMGPFAERLARMEADQARAVTIERTLTELRDRVVTIETKAAIPPQLDPAIGELRERIAVFETKGQLSSERDVQPPPFDAREAIADLHHHLDKLEIKAAQPLAIETTVADIRDRFEGFEKRFHEIATAASTIRERIAVLETRQPIPGPPGPAGKDGADGKDGKDGEPGQAGMSFAGVYEEGKAYKPGQLATWAGSGWHCNKATTSKPGDGSSDWTLMIKKGRDGKDGRDAVTVPVVSIGGPK